MSKDDWKKGRAESAMLEYEKQQMKKHAEEFKKKRAEEKEVTMETYDNKEKENYNWTKYKIVVPSERDKVSLELAFEHLHYTDCDTNYVPVNQLIHEYLTEKVTGDPKSKNNIIVNSELYDKLSNDE
jgi:hypothetical protein